jgi:ribosome maturation factor RimP
MKGTAQEQRISSLIEPVLKDLGFDLVQVRLLGSQKLQTLQIMAEDPETGNLDLDSCTEVSRAVGVLLDVEDPIASAYQLEVSSPGIDRPLVRPRDFEKAVGREINVETETPDANGQKRFKGRLTAFDSDKLTLADENGTTIIGLADVVKARLVLTDELFKMAQPKKPTKKPKPEKEDQKVKEPIQK